ncbi:bifunctional diaminohydroxyphosphoribosylaminopyrimidine deaminase/5-amino-6-(5-phosphoribosylamino)uracil reductase RibD [Synechococcus sp. CB0101]|nr:bifunctional diaminohydroxyphosphoribosylaminopyrimidine deaminase/5-amino-6-(5-phosphoribosylamino)uracil reductase RibD [Synechococcus sp. CB0101]
MAQPAQLARGSDQPHRRMSSPWRPWMQRALQLAALGNGRTSPNPLVGCVVLDRAGQLVGEGFHQRAGTPHAEVHALRQAGERARGGTAVVTLEPCCHHGRTPPCSEALLAAGVARVVVAMRDPDPRVAGKGLAQLRDAGVDVLEGVCEAEARILNRGFLHRVEQGRPLGLLKWAMSLDGRTALPNGSSQWISGPPARAWVHHLRAQCDAVIVGGGTVRADNPLLTSRGQRTPEPLRVVISRSLDLPKQAQLWNQSEAATLVVHSSSAPAEQLDRLDGLGVERLVLERCEPLELLEALGQRGCNQVLWECGPELAAAALRQGCVQQVAAVLAPKLLGGTAARTPLGDLGLVDVNQAVAWSRSRLQQLGNDCLLELSP